MMKKVDAIIVGLGISGSLLSAEFLKNGKSILVIDEEKKKHIFKNCGRTL